jgi:hypothetical protein
MKKVATILCVVVCVVIYFLSTRTTEDRNFTKVTHLNDIIKGEKQK